MLWGRDQSQRCPNPSLPDFGCPNLVSKPCEDMLCLPPHPLQTKPGAPVCSHNAAPLNTFHEGTKSKQICAEGSPGEPGAPRSVHRRPPASTQPVTQLLLATRLPYRSLYSWQPEPLPSARGLSGKSPPPAPARTGAETAAQGGDGPR